MPDNQLTLINCTVEKEPILCLHESKDRGIWRCAKNINDFGNPFVRAKKTKTAEPDTLVNSLKDPSEQNICQTISQYMDINLDGKDNYYPLGKPCEPCEEEVCECPPSAKSVINELQKQYDNPRNKSKRSSIQSCIDRIDNVLK